MTQGIIGGGNSYGEQSLKDILSDLQSWISYTKDSKQFITDQKDKLVKNHYWVKIPYDFKATVDTTILYFDTIIYDINLIIKAIDKNVITEKEVKLLRNIGRKSFEYNHEYPKTFKEERRYWHEYGHPDFAVAEELYAKGRDYFVTMQDAGNAAIRLEDYMEKGHVVNNTLNISGNVSKSQIQQGSVTFSQILKNVETFDYESVRTILNKIQNSISNKENLNDFGETADRIERVVANMIEMVNRKDEPSKIKNAFLMLKELAMGVTGSLIATGIVGLIQQLPIW